MAPETHVAIVGASGETGGSIIDALLASPDQFQVTALARSESLAKPQYAELEKRGVAIKPADLKSSANMAELFGGVDVAISYLTIAQEEEERALVTAAKEAGVSRYVPSFFGPCCPPRGVMSMRGRKEDILDYIKKLYLPYTDIDVGWWYQLSLPRLPSGNIDAQFALNPAQIIGDGNTDTALTDNRDIGKFVARIIADPRTLNKQVFAYGEVCSQNHVFDLLEKLSGESIPRQPTSEQDLKESVSKAQAAIAQGSREI